MPHAAFRANAQQPKLFVGMILILIFAEALALYGLIGACIGCGCHAPGHCKELHWHSLEKGEALVLMFQLGPHWKRCKLTAFSSTHAHARL